MNNQKSNNDLIPERLDQDIIDISNEGLMSQENFEKRHIQDNEKDILKAIPMDHVLNHLGIYPIIEHDNRYKCKYECIESNERTASANIYLHKTKNIDLFICHADRTLTVDNIGLVEKVTGKNFVDSVKWLRNLSDTQPIEPTINKPKTNKSTIIHISPTPANRFQKKVLRDYLKERGIYHEHNIEFLKIPNGAYYIAFKNDKGGYALRNNTKYLNKRNLNEMYITTLIGDYNDHNVRIFEGFMDYLSYIELFKDRVNENYIVLNSNSNKEIALELLNNSHFVNIGLYLDNDNSGSLTTNYFLNRLKNVQITDFRSKYANFKDFNEFLISR